MKAAAAVAERKRGCLVVLLDELMKLLRTKLILLLLRRHYLRVGHLGVEKVQQPRPRSYCIQLNYKLLEYDKDDRMDVKKG
jgi:hypothetical protein